MTRLTMGFLLCTALPAAPVSAQITAEAFCPELGKWAEITMLTRQAGTALSEMLALLPDTGDAAADAMLDAVVMGAFEVPRYSTPQNQTEAAQDYRAMIELACYQGFLDD